MDEIITGPGLYWSENTYTYIFKMPLKVIKTKETNRENL